MAKKEAVETKTLGTPESKIKEIEKDLTVLVKDSKKVLVITDEKGVAQATEFLSKVKGRLDRIEELRDTFVRPLNDHVKKINAMFKEQSAPLATMMMTVKRAVADFKLKEEAEARKEEDRLQKIRDAANAKREEKGRDIIETPIASVIRVESTVRTDAGRTTSKKVWKFQITDPNKVPRQYCAVDEKAIRTAVAYGTREIEGVNIYEDFDISVSAR